LALEGNDVHCFISPDHKVLPASGGGASPKIHILTYDYEQFQKSLAEVESALNLVAHDAAIWIGHDAITGGAAILNPMRRITRWQTVLLIVRDVS
jgi:hypothetical protein